MGNQAGADQFAVVVGAVAVWVVAVAAVQRAGTAVAVDWAAPS